MTKRVYIFASPTTSEDVYISRVFDNLDEALAHIESGESEGCLIACGVGSTPNMKWLSDYSEPLKSSILEEREYLEEQKSWGIE